MAGNTKELNEVESASGVSNADIWAALDNLEVAQPTNEETEGAEADEAPEETVTDMGHGSEVETAEEPEESAGGENAGDEEAEEAEEAETGQEEEEEEAQETEAEEAEEPPKGIREMEKRIHKLTGRSKELERENTTLREQLGQAQPITLQPTASDPLAHLNTAQAVVEQVEGMRAFKAWAMKHLDGGELQDKDGNLRELSAEEVREDYTRADEIISLHAPARLEYLAKKQRYDQLCKEVYPELFNAKSPESQMAWAFVRENPGILKLPQYALIIGDAIRGGRLREEEAKAKAAKAAGQRPGATLQRPGQKFAPRAISAGAAKNVRSNGASQLHQRFLQTGSKKDLEAYLERTLA